MDRIALSATPSQPEARTSSADQRARVAPQDAINTEPDATPATSSELSQTEITQFPSQTLVRQTASSCVRTSAEHDKRDTDTRAEMRILDTPVGFSKEALPPSDCTTSNRSQAHSGVILELGPPKDIPGVREWTPSDSRRGNLAAFGFMGKQGGKNHKHHKKRKHT